MLERCRFSTGAKRADLACGTEGAAAARKCLEIKEGVAQPKSANAPRTVENVGIFFVRRGDVPLINLGTRP